MSKKLCQRFIVLFGLLFLLACSVLVLPASEAAVRSECEDCYAKCSSDYEECLAAGIEKPWKCSQYRHNCINYCNAEYCNQ
ncbi:MAG TPA: hypothetical protein VK400_05935 [Pyrinomonadaceae bacterium]|nr:hypothetical protein [Pyrinomonadaceae bacterium]